MNEVRLLYFRETAVAWKYDPFCGTNILNKAFYNINVFFRDIFFSSVFNNLYTEIITIRWKITKERKYVSYVINVYMNYSYRCHDNVYMLDGTKGANLIFLVNLVVNFMHKYAPLNRK